MGLALVQTRQRAVLPQDGRGVGQRALEPLMTAPQCPVAQLQTLVKDLPEFGPYRRPEDSATSTRLMVTTP